MKEWDNRKRASGEVSNYRRYLVELLKRRKPTSGNKNAIRILKLAITLADMKRKRNSEDSNTVDQKEEDSIVAEIAEMMESTELSHEERSAVSNMMDISTKTIKTGGKVNVLNLAPIYITDAVSSLKKAVTVARTLNPVPKSNAPTKSLSYALSAWKNILRNSQSLSTENEKIIAKLQESKKRENSEILKIRDEAEEMVNKLEGERTNRRLTAFYKDVLIKMANSNYFFMKEISRYIMNRLDGGAFTVSSKRFYQEEKTVNGKSEYEMIFDIELTNRDDGSKQGYYRVVILNTSKIPPNVSGYVIVRTNKDPFPNENGSSGEDGKVIFENVFEDKDVDILKLGRAAVDRILEYARSEVALR